LKGAKEGERGGENFRKKKETKREKQQLIMERVDMS